MYRYWYLKIDGFKLNIFSMVIGFFKVDYKDRKFWFFKKTFLLANFSIDITLNMFFLTLSNVEVNFVSWDLS